MLFFRDMFTYPLFLIFVVQVLCTLKISSNSIFPFISHKYIRPILIFQIISIVYTIFLLVCKIMSGLYMCAYRPYQAIRTVDGKDFQKVINMEHFIKEYGKD
jgi:hypothetical protein